MNKQNILSKYSNPEDKLLISKILDKINFSETRNKITNTNFLDVRQQKLVQTLLNTIKTTNYTQTRWFYKR